MAFWCTAFVSLALYPLQQILTPLSNRSLVTLKVNVYRSLPFLLNSAKCFCVKSVANYEKNSKYILWTLHLFRRKSRLLTRAGDLSCRRLRLGVDSDGCLDVESLKDIFCPASSATFSFSWTGCTGFTLGKRSKRHSGYLWTIQGEREPKIDFRKKKKDSWQNCGSTYLSLWQMCVGVKVCSPVLLLCWGGC